MARSSNGAYAKHPSLQSIGLVNAFLLKAPVLPLQKPPRLVPRQPALWPCKRCWSACVAAAGSSSVAAVEHTAALADGLALEEAGARQSADRLPSHAEALPSPCTGAMEPSLPNGASQPARSTPPGQKALTRNRPGQGASPLDKSMLLHAFLMHNANKK
jgi:hypothetical protein